MYSLYCKGFLHDVRYVPQRRSKTIFDKISSTVHGIVFSIFMGGLLVMHGEDDLFCLC